MSKKRRATTTTVDRFLEAVYPGAVSLATAVFDEEATLNAATDTMEYQSTRIAALEAENAALKAAIRWVRTTTYQMFDHPDDGGASHTRADFDPENWESAHPIVRSVIEEGER